MKIFESNNEYVSRTEARQIKKWDDEIRNFGGDEEVWGYWIMYGVPDHMDDWSIDDYLWFDKGDFIDFEETYKICKSMMKDPRYN